jgi:hypothetical protein
VPGPLLKHQSTLLICSAIIILQREKVRYLKLSTSTELSQNFVFSKKKDQISVAHALKDGPVCASTSTKPYPLSCAVTPH